MVLSTEKFVTSPLNDDQPELITTRNGFTLNAQQSNAIIELEKWWINPTSKFFCLQGYAGTGKTTTIQEFLYRIQQGKRIYVCVAAPTNKATKVLERMAMTWGLHNIDFATIYQLLGMKLEVNDDGSEEAVADPNKSESLTKYDLVICDEASMIPGEIWGMLSGRVNIPKMIFMGDPGQLPPIGEVKSKVFSVKDTLTLTQVMRYGNVIGELVDSIRDNLDVDEFILPETCLDENNSGIEVLDKFDWLDQLTQEFKSDAYKDNPDYVRALAWTNKATVWINDYVRKGLYGEKAPQFIVGERLIATRPVVQGQEILMTNSSECQIVSCGESEMAGFDIWTLRVEDEKGNRHRLWILDSGSRGAFSIKLDSLAKEALSFPPRTKERTETWRKYYNLRDMFAPLNHCYALTVHKSQGSTFTHTYVCLSDILKNRKVKERNQLLYVAYSRASKKLVITE